MKLPLLKLPWILLQNFSLVPVFIQQLFGNFLFFSPNLPWPASLNSYLLSSRFYSPLPCLISQCSYFSPPSEIPWLPSLLVNGSHLDFFFSLHPLPLSINYFFSLLPTPNPLGLEVKELNANRCQIYYIQSSPLDWVAFCSIEKQGI